MKLIDWLAVFGALAWLPHLIRFGYHFLTKPRLRIITGVAPELGFTTYGPIFNMRLAFVVDHKDLVISGMRIRLRHESGSDHLFVWQGLMQTLGTLSNPQMGNMPFQKESNVLALKAKVADVDERFVRFQSIEFISGKHPIEAKASSRIMYLQRQGREIDVEAFLRSDEMTDLCAYIKRSFAWKQGSYSLKFEVDSPQSFKIIGDMYEFSLTQVDVEELEKNTAQVERDYRERFIPRKEEEPALVWVWRYPKLIAKET